MKNLYGLLLTTAMVLLLAQQSAAQVTRHNDSWGEQGLTLISETRSNILVNSSLQEYELIPVIADGITGSAVSIPGVFLPNEAGAPDLPATSRYIAIPAGARARINILASRTELIPNVDIAPAPEIPLDTDPNPLQYTRDPGIYSKNAFYPAQPVILSEPEQIRGIDVVMLSITPFQYNPITRELIVYRDLKVEVTLEGGTGKVGDDRLRSRWWDPLILGSVMNPEAIPAMEYQTIPSANRTPDYEYLIITPDIPAYLQWADSIKVWRTLQGIKTGVVTTTALGGNTTTAIKNYISNAYNTWDVPPVAVLLLGDYSTGTTGINSPLYIHPAGYPNFASDNYYTDMNSNDLPDLVISRITARNATELQVMVTKFLNYERIPPTDPAFYDQPVTALGWQTERWFQICSEAIGGFFRNAKGKNPTRINAVYLGNPTVDPWSSATNTSTVVNYFGPNGLGYIPSTPQQLGGFSGGTGTMIVNAINAGTFMVMHRDHGYYEGWGEPAFSISNISSLTNVNNKLPFVFSINCQTGAYHRSSDCFAEVFHRRTYNGQNSGALGVIAPTEVSYSFVNDTYVWGVMDNMFPDFMPGYTTQFPASFAYPAFGMAAGKLFLYQSSWPYNTGDKLVTYRLFHCHGDAFMPLYSEVPQNLTVAHASTLESGTFSFTVNANAGSTIALTVNGQILATATGTGAPLSIAIPPQAGGQTMKVTVTKQNFYRYSANVNITGNAVVAMFTGTPTSICQGQSVTYTDQSVGTPTSWIWSFPGGDPGTYDGQVPPPVYYSTTGTYGVTLTVSNAEASDTETKTAYITVSGLDANFSGSPLTIMQGHSVTFTDLSTCGATTWLWSFEGGNPATANGPGPHSVFYDTPGTYDVTLVVGDGTIQNTESKPNYVTVTAISYCSSHGNATAEWIKSFTLNGQTITTNSSGAAGYQDYTSTVFSLNPGNSYGITLVPGFAGSAFNEYYKIWIDFNHDGDFMDSGEEVFSAPKKKATVSGTLSVPAGLDITTRMRIAMKRNAFAGSCEVFASGEVEDYTVDIAAPAPQPPVANFSGSPVAVLPGGSVSFTDLSTNNPTSWYWTFPGGTPGSSTAQNPTVVYNTAGVYDVTLMATNAVGPDTETKAGYITVSTTPPAPVYCVPSGINNNSDYINSITIGATSNPSGKGLTGYTHYTSPVFSFNPGQSYSYTLVPYNSTNRNFWRIWIDLNGDGDFTDADETFVTLNNKKGTATGTFTIPANVSSSTRMRISMRTGASQLPCDNNFNGEVEDYNVTFAPEDWQQGNSNALLLQVYPNPAREFIKVQVSGNEGPVTIRFYSAQGKIVSSLETREANVEIDVSAYPSGLYFINAGDGKQQATEKVLLK
jgi:PKD repeat protein